MVCGGGPSGLYFALLAKKQIANIRKVTVFEQNPRDATFGFGIVLADRGLNRLKWADPESCDVITQSCFQSRNRIVTHRDEKIFIEGGGSGGAIARLRLLQILQRCCESAGVEVLYEHPLDAGKLPEADLIVGADGVNSVVRAAHADGFGTTSHTLTGKLAWYGTAAHFPYPILSFKQNDMGYFWCVAYAHTESMSTFVAECDANTWLRSGLHAMNEEEARRFCEKLFASELRGHHLLSNKSLWGSFPVTRVQRWHVGNKVLIGDALHSAHPSIGSGTRIAMEDSIALINALKANRSLADALHAFQRDRGPGKQSLLVAAEKSINWYETVVPRLERYNPLELVFDYMARTGRIDEPRLMAEYPRFMRQYGARWREFMAARDS